MSNVERAGVRRGARGCRVGGLIAAAWAAVMGAAVVGGSAVAVEAVPDATRPLADPVQDDEVVLRCRSAATWREGAVRWLVLEGDAGVEAGPYRLRGSSAVVRIDVQRLPWRVVRHVAVYLVDARSAGGSAVRQSAPRLLTTVSTTGVVTLKADAIAPATAPRPTGELIDAARARIDRRYAALTAAVLPGPTAAVITPEVAERRDADRAARELDRVSRRLSTLRDRQLAGAPEGERNRLAAAQGRVDERLRRELAAAEGGVVPEAPALARGEDGDAVSSVLPTVGQVNLSAERIVEQPGTSPTTGDAMTAVMLIGDVRVAYLMQGQPSVTLEAERAVIFMRGGLRGGRTVEALAVEGVYLEDAAVITAGDYSVRTPRAYYDLSTNRAVLLDAVLYAYDTQLQLPLYLRAETLRQTSAASFEGERALLTTSEFAEPHFAMGAGRLRVEEEDTADGRTQQRFVINDATLRYQGTPVFWFPRLSGSNAETPLRSARAGYSNDDGPTFETRWDAFGLVGEEQPSGGDLEVALDYIAEHGPGLGFYLDYDVDGEFFGEGYVYSLLWDSGTDDLRGRRDIERDDGAFRYAGRIQHRHFLPAGIEASVEAASVSDETFLDWYSQTELEEVKPYETSLYLKKATDDWAGTFLIAGNIDDFTPQFTTLQTPGYAVAKLPEGEFTLPGLSVFEEYAVWSSQTSVSGNVLQFGEDDPARRGFSPNATAEVFGFADRDPSIDFDERFESQGLPDDVVTRFDTRQEIAMPLALGDLRLTPYGVGRFTAYDTDFEEFSGQDQQMRLWGELGVRVSTTFARSYAASSRALGLRGLRHVVEPEVHASIAESSLNPDDLPVFDFDTEPLNQGGRVTVGATQRFQTLRGGFGRRRSVDWITLETRYTVAEDEEDGPGTGVIPVYVDYRPEYSIGGDHFYSEMLVAVSDSVSLTGDVTFDGDFSDALRWNVGVLVQHTRNLTTFAGYRETPVLDERLLNYGLTYQLTTKYRVGASQTLDIENEESRSVSGWLERKLPRWTFRVSASFDTVDDRQTFGFVLVPDGVTGISPVGFSSGRRENNGG